MPRTLKLGMEGDDVTMLQQLLTERGYPVAPVGTFGPKTFAALCDFQEHNLDQGGRALEIDGQVGPATWWSLTRAPADRAVVVPAYSPVTPQEQRAVAG
ncbi:MAG TPA: peptidoglycan-binding domain-containing protein [Gemmatimonadaceae bacterium]|nr:peptidoglycan-binding domain-containing protein [Gemmatimonadaceae bacterium]